jgi:hypothetical protein
MEVEDKLLSYFGVKNHKELTEYIKNNPTDKKVLMLKELLMEWGVDIDNKKNQ